MNARRSPLRRIAALLLLSRAAAMLAAPAKGDPQSILEHLRQSVAAKQVPGAVVIVQQHGRVVFQEAVGYAVLEEKRPMRLDDIFMIASSTKPFSATTIMTLVDQGKLGLDDSVEKFFPEFEGSSTVRQLLSHTSGIFGNDAPRETVEPIRNFDRELKDAVSLILRTPLAHKPGELFSYGGASFCVAGRIAEKITGLDFETYMKKALLEPLALQDTMFRSKRDISERIVQLYRRTADGRFEAAKAVMEPPARRGPRADGFVLVPGGLYSTASDAVRFLQMHLNGGEYQGKRILSQQSAEEMRKKQTGAEVGEEYGLGWRRQKVRPNGDALVVGHGGAYGTQLWVDFERGLAAAVFTQMPLRQAQPFIAETRRRIEAAYPSALGGKQ